MENQKIKKTVIYIAITFLSLLFINTLLISDFYIRDHFYKMSFKKIIGGTLHDDQVVFLFCVGCLLFIGVLLTYLRSTLKNSKNRSAKLFGNRYVKRGKPNIGKEPNFLNRQNRNLFQEIPGSLPLDIKTTEKSSDKNTQITKPDKEMSENLHNKDNETLEKEEGGKDKKDEERERSDKNGKIIDEKYNNEITDTIPCYGPDIKEETICDHILFDEFYKAKEEKEESSGGLKEEISDLREEFKEEIAGVVDRTSSILKDEFKTLEEIKNQLREIHSILGDKFDINYKGKITKEEESYLEKRIDLEIQANSLLDTIDEKKSNQLKSKNTVIYSKTE